MRVAIVNDLKLAVEVLRQSVLRIPGAEVAWIAEDGRQAIERCAEDRPDVVLMDMQMPVMDGAIATREIMRRTPCPIIVVTASIQANLDRVYDALGAGALDVTTTPTFGPGGSIDGLDSLARKIDHVRQLEHGHAVRLPQASRAAPSGRGIIAIGASTGGPQALAAVLPRGMELPAPVVIVQHIDRAFAPGLAEWLARETGHAVTIAQDGQAPTVGMVHVACSDDHLVLEGGRFAHRAEPRTLAHRPSVDVFFESLVGQPRGVAVLLTGMGRDGAEGLRALRRAGWHTIAQDEATSVVWGMPGAAVALGAAVEVLPINRIAQAIEIACAAPRSA
ncbi:MAG: chemotaxis-specific protein-glutamate methyltransferase CheB [Planctomycetes bacterium]|nr:chemotaxis-specific protein-glutamate methyltransferase CheB [Planctomycetota bacterium]